MAHHHFISYSTADAGDFSLRLCNALEGQALPAWLDQRKLVLGRPWDRQLAQAIRECDSLIFVMSRDSVEDGSVCNEEWALALKYKKPVTPLLLHSDADAPFRLTSRQHVDFTGEFDPALRRLCDHLHWLASPAGVLQAMEDRLADARRDLRRAPVAERPRIEDDIALLEKQIAGQQRVVENPQAAAAVVEQRIAAGLERERQPARPEPAVARRRFINPPPGAAPGYFQDRVVETKLVGDLIRDAAHRLIWLVGRGGIGKTALVCRLLKALEGGQLPDEGGELAVRGIVYLSAAGSRRVTVPNLYADLCRLLPPEVAGPLDALYRDPRTTTRAKMGALLEQFPADPSGPVVVLLDNFEDLVDPQALGLLDTEMDEALRALLDGSHHAVTFVVTSRIAPRPLLLVQPGRQKTILLDEGLPAPYAQNILRERDADGKVGLRDAPDALLEEARVRTRGYPRALEALFAILAADRGTTLREVLDEAAGELPENVTEALVGEAFGRLDSASQRVIQALAIYGVPVTPAAVDYLLQPHLPGVDSGPGLTRLAHMHFARREAGRYYLHPVDRAYALGRVPKGEPSDRRDTDTPSFTRLALLHRAAEYFKQARLPRQEWKKIEDLSPQLAEFELRCAGEDYDAAGDVLTDIDGNSLLRWGFYRLVTNLHERLQGKLKRATLQGVSAGNLGLAYQLMGQVHKAIAYQERALASARQRQSRQGEGIWLGNLGSCYSDLGQTAKAIEYHEQALAISRETGDRRFEGSDLCSLGRCYSALGQTAKAIEYHEQALALGRATGDRRGEGNRLGNSGSCYSDLGQTAKAIEFYERALAIRRETGDRFGEATDLVNLAEVLVDEARYDKALTCAKGARELAREISSPAHGSYSGYYIALAELFTDNLSAARAAAEEARQSDVPVNNHKVCALLALIALRQGDQAAARQASGAAVAHADSLLAHTPQTYDAADAKGLALCGLAACGEAGVIPVAVSAFQAARAVNRDAGIVGRVLRLFDAMAVADTAGVLAGVRPAAAGQ